MRIVSQLVFVAVVGLPFVWSMSPWAFTAQSGETVVSRAPASVGPVDSELLDELVLANRILALEGVFDSQGHVSVRHPRDPNRYLMSHARAPELVTADDIIEFDLDSNPVDTRGRTPYSERFIHGEIYRARSDVSAIVHSHSPSTIPFGVSSIPIRAMAHSGAFIGEGLPIYEIRESGGMTDMLVSSPALGRAIARSIGRHAAVLMRGHGVTVVGPHLRHVVGRSIYLEVNAMLQIQAIALGGTITYLDPEEARRIEGRRNYNRQWEMWTRRVSGK